MISPMTLLLEGGERMKIMMMPACERKRYSLIFIISVFACVAMLLACTAQVSAATVADIPDNVMRLGNDFYSMDSDNFTDNQIVVSLVVANKGYFKTGGKWYNIFELSDSQIANSQYAESDTSINGWQITNGTWYKSGSATESVTSTGIGGTYTIQDYNSYSKKMVVTITGISGASYFNVFNSGTKLADAAVQVSDGGVVSASAMFSSDNLSNLSVVFYSDAAGTTTVATATVNSNGTLNVTASESGITDFYVTSID